MCLLNIMDPSNAPKENLTFEDLSYMTDQWISDLRYSEEIFRNQYTEADMWTNNTIRNGISLRQFNDKLNYLRCLQTDVDRDVDRIRHCEHFMELAVQNLENRTQAFEGKTVTDRYRSELYDTAVQVNSILKSFEQMCENYLVKLKDKFKCYLDDPHEAIAQVLMTQLDLLEQIEIKIQQLRNKVDVNDFKSQLALQKYNLRENKGY